MVTIIDSNTPIHVPGASRVHDTALAELALALATPIDSLNVIRQDARPPDGIVLALIDESTPAKELIWAGLVNLHNIDPAADAYELLAHDGTLFLLGNTPRGMLHAVYCLQELLAAGPDIPDNFHQSGAFQIPSRIFHQRFDSWPGQRADIRYISHLGASHCLVTHDWQGDLRHLQGYVTSPLFPKAVDADRVATNHASLRLLLEDCADYGLDTCIWLTELPCQGGPWVPELERREFLKRYPLDVLSDCGTYQGQVLCFSHPQVQQFYRDLLSRFFRDFPEIGTIFLFGLDAGGEFCDPQQCPRCRGMSKFAQRDRLLNFLIEHGQKARPGLRVLTTSWGWEARGPDEFLRRQGQLPAACGLYMAAESDGCQSERQCHDFLRQARRICRQKGQLFIGYDDFHWGDDSAWPLNDIQDFPLGIAAKIRRWHNLHVDGVFDHWGPWCQDISCNSIALREFFLNPLADAKTVCKDIAVKQFGPEAGPLVCQAWQRLDRAHSILSNCCDNGSSWPNWYGGRESPPIPAVLDQAKPGQHLSAKQAFPIIYNAGDQAAVQQRLSDGSRMAFPFYMEAVTLLTEALENVQDAPLFYSFWWVSDTDSAPRKQQIEWSYTTPESTKKNSPSRREHIRRQRIYVESMALIGREMGTHFGLCALYERVERDASRYKQAAEELLRSNVQACLAAADYLDKLQAAGDDRKPDRDWPDLYRKKAAAIERYLAANRANTRSRIR